MNAIKLCGSCLTKFKPKDGVKVKRIIGTREFLFNKPFISNSEISQYVEVIA